MKLFIWLSLSIFFTSFGNAAEIKGDLLKWHKVILLLSGPDAKEEPATFRNYRLNVTFTKGSKKYIVPGHFAADGDAAQTGATSGNKWRVLFTPDETGVWLYQVSFRTGTDVAISPDANAGTPLTSLDGETGTFTISPSDKQAPDFRARGRLHYTGKHYQQFTEDGSYWLAIGPGSPEDFFGGSEIDATRVGMKDQFYPDHQQDWKTGDPLWHGGKGKGLIGALNYIIGLGQTSMFVIMMTAFGDSNDTWPWAQKDTTVNGINTFSVNGLSTFDVSKLDQWEMILAHAQKNGVAFHAYLGEEESEQLWEKVEGLAMGGDSTFAKTRKLYYREIVSRLGHFNALDWNIGEELGGCAGCGTPAQQVYGFPVISKGQIKLFADYVHALDPYGHSVGFEGDQNRAMQDYSRWFAGPEFDRAAIQGFTPLANEYSITLRDSSKAKGRPWVINFSEHHNPNVTRTITDANLLDFRNSAWGTFLGGGAGLEWWLSMDDYYLTSYIPYTTLMLQTAHVRDFMIAYLPFWQMEPANALLPANAGYCFALKDEIYAAYVHNAGDVKLNLSGTTGSFNIYWYDTQNGGALKTGTVAQVQGGTNQSLGQPPSATGSDWTVLVRKVNYTGTKDLHDDNASARHAYVVNAGNSLSLTLQQKCKIEASIYSLQGRLLRTLFNGDMTAGQHSISLQGNRNAAHAGADMGICIIRSWPEGQDHAEVHRLIILNAE